MSFFSKPVGALCSLLLLLQLFNLSAAIKIDSHSCTGAYKSQVDKALDEVEAMVKYAEKRAAPKSQYRRQGTLLQDLLHASNEDDVYVLRKVQATFTEVLGTLKKNDIVIHCNDKHLTRSTKTVYHDNSNGRAARVQVLDSPKRSSALGACGGIQRAFAYPFYDAKTHKPAGEAIVLCSDSSVGALKAADDSKDIAFWRNKDLRNVGQGIDMFGRYLSYMILHELMHATDQKSFPVNPGGQAEKYGYEEITGHKVGTTGDGGPSSLVRLQNADSYALLACGWYMNAYSIENGKFVLTAKKDRPPVTLRRRFPELDARDPKSKPKPKSSKADDPAPATSKAAPASTQAPPVSTQAPPASSRAPPPSDKASSNSPATAHTSSPIISPTNSASHSISVTTKSSSTSSWLPPLVTAAGDAASKFPKLPPLAIPIVVLPDFGFGNGTDLNSTLPISGTGTGIGVGTAASTNGPFSAIPTGWNATMVVTSPAGSGTVLGVGMQTTGFVTVTTSCTQA